MMAPRERESTRLGEAQRACELKLPDTRCKNFPTFSACAREKKKGNFSSSSYIPPSSGAFLSLSVQPFWPKRPESSCILLHPMKTAQCHIAGPRRITPLARNDSARFTPARELDRLAAHPPGSSPQVRPLPCRLLREG
jgi:hypothetical protein